MVIWQKDRFATGGDGKFSAGVLGNFEIGNFEN